MVSWLLADEGVSNGRGGGARAYAGHRCWVRGTGVVTTLRRGGRLDKGGERAELRREFSCSGFHGAFGRYFFDCRDTMLLLLGRGSQNHEVLRLLG